MSSKLYPVNQHSNSLITYLYSDSGRLPTHLEEWALDQQTEERLRFLNQEIADTRALLDATEDWDFYESAPLKYKLIVLTDERSRMASDFQRRTEQKLRAAAERSRPAHDESRASPNVDPVREEIDWVSAKIQELLASLLKAPAQDRPGIRALLKGYREYWTELMTKSGRLQPGERDTVGRWQEPESENQSSRAATEVEGERLNGSEKRKGARKSSRRRNMRRATKTAGEHPPLLAVLEIVSLLRSLAALR